MSKIHCNCGYVIVDQTNTISNKAYFIRDQDLDAVDNYLEDISNFIQAIQKGKRMEWLTNYFDSNVYAELPDSAVIADIISKYTLTYQSEMYLCQQCGRVYIQKNVTNQFISFLPEENRWGDIFKGLSQNETNILG